MPEVNQEALEGTTLNVYMYAVKENRALGPRDVMRGLHLSSPSVAYRHLQKLESLNLLKKDELGEYIVVKKTSVNGFHWVGRLFLPRTMFYFLFFFILFVIEAVILVIHLPYLTYEPMVFYTLGLTITGTAMTFFLLEALLALRKLKIKDGI